MALTPEGKVKAAVVRILKAEGIYYFFPATHGMGRSGVPDIVCCIGGQFVGIEVKAKGGKLTALQRRELSLIQKAGGSAFTIGPDSLKALPGFIELIKSERWWVRNSR